MDRIGAGRWLAAALGVGAAAALAAIAIVYLIGNGGEADPQGEAPSTPTASAGQGEVGGKTEPDGTGGSGSVNWVPRLSKKRSTIWAIGDAADGGDASRELAAMLTGDRVDRLIYLGDVYATGTPFEFATKYDPVFGRFARRTIPVVGNHDWLTRRFGYDRYWARVHGAPTPLYYATEASGWQLLALNSETARGEESPQVRWLRRTLAGSDRFGNCRIVLAHQPRYNAGRHGDAGHMRSLLRPLRGRARIALGGHDHNLQRLRAVDGIVTLISGAGGHGLYEIDHSDPRLRFGEDEAYGGLRLELRRGRAEYRFVSTDGKTLDSGGLRCRRA